MVQLLQHITGRVNLDFLFTVQLVLRLVLLLLLLTLQELFQNGMKLLLKLLMMFQRKST